MVRRRLQVDQPSGHHILLQQILCVRELSAVLLCITTGVDVPKAITQNAVHWGCCKRLLKRSLFIAAGDVFRFPSYPSLFSACVGTGTQVRRNIYALHLPPACCADWLFLLIPAAPLSAL